MRSRIERDYEQFFPYALILPRALHAIQSAQTQPLPLRFHPPNLTASRERVCNSASYLGIISAKSNRSPISVKYVTQPKASTC